ncbi:MAG: carbon-nitrogen hydrolase family protein [Caulobacteraceae bacterium]
MLKVGLVQLTTPSCQAAALAHAAPLVREAAASGAQLIITPEGTNFLQKDRRKLFEILAPPEEDEAVRGLAALARELAVWLLVGSALVKRPDGSAANRSMLFDPDGGLSASYDKIHMFDVDLPTGERHRESGTYRAGAQAVIAEAAGARLGLTICYDLRFPLLSAALARAGAQIITVPSAFTRPTGEAHWELLLRARAVETGAFVLAAAQGGRHEDGRATWGRSMAISPWGEVRAAADHDHPGLVLAELDLEEVDRARAAIPALANVRAFEGP